MIDGVAECSRPHAGGYLSTSRAEKIPGKFNERCGPGAELALLLPPLMWLWQRCSRRV
jgi:hypothetical protein